MTHDHADAGDDVLEGLDLQMWRVPPPAALDRPALLVRALAPATPPPKRARLAWILAAIVLVNAAIATVIVVLVARPAPQLTATVQPAGGGSVDAEVRDLLVRLAREQRELERKLTEIQELRTLVLELAEKVRQYEQQDGRRDRPSPKPRPPIESKDTVTPPSFDRCDEVSCVLSNHEGACCTKFRPPGMPIVTKPPPNDFPEGLDRHSISDGIASVKSRVRSCATQSSARGQVKVRVKVGPEGLVTSVSVGQTPDAALGRCVAAAVQTAVFSRTQHGGSFSYPFVF